jgi:hypothetical protein
MSEEFKAKPPSGWFVRLRHGPEDTVRSYPAHPPLRGHASAIITASNGYITLLRALILVSTTDL